MLTRLERSFETTRVWAAQAKVPVGKSRSNGTVGATTMYTVDKRRIWGPVSTNSNDVYTSIMYELTIFVGANVHYQTPVCGMVHPEPETSPIIGYRYTCQIRRKPLDHMSVVEIVQ
jgi:hypothetical protein